MTDLFIKGPMLLKWSSKHEDSLVTALATLRSTYLPSVLSDGNNTVHLKATAHVSLNWLHFLLRQPPSYGH
jgi:hypothetical protein